MGGWCWGMAVLDILKLVWSWTPASCCTFLLQEAVPWSFLLCGVEAGRCMTHCMLSSFSRGKKKKRQKSKSRILIQVLALFCKVFLIPCCWKSVQRATYFCALLSNLCVCLGCKPNLCPTGCMCWTTSAPPLGGRVSRFQCLEKFRVMS